MSEDTVYINKISIKEKTFDNGGSVLNVAVHVDELIIHKNKDGWVNLSVNEEKLATKDILITPNLTPTPLRQKSQQVQRPKALSRILICLFKKWAIILNSILTLILVKSMSVD